MKLKHAIRIKEEMETKIRDLYKEIKNTRVAKKRDKILKEVSKIEDGLVELKKLIQKANLAKRLKFQRKFPFFKFEESIADYIYRLTHLKLRQAALFPQQKKTSAFNLLKFINREISNIEIKLEKFNSERSIKFAI